MKKIIFSFLGIIMMIQTQAQIVGDWNGILEIGDAQLSIIFHITENEGVYTSTLDSPDQGAKGIPADETSFENNELEVAVHAAAMTYTGKYDKLSNTIKGDFTQGGRTVSLDLTKEEVKKKVNARKQEPKDFPYHVEEVEVKNEVAGVILAGTLTMPKDQKMKQVVILISGSGAQDRNADLGPMNHRPFLVWSDYLTRNGIAVLRYDDRGIAKSTGDFTKATSADFADDAEAAVKYLQSREDMKDVKIGLMGHSEGGMVAPMVAARNKDVDFIVLLAGPGIATNQLLLKQKYDLMKVSAFPKEIIDQDQKNGKAVFDYIKKNKELENEAFEEGLKKIVQENVKGYPLMMKGGKPDEEVVKMEMAQYSSPWFKYFISYDPAENLARTKCPVLAINGTLDLQVSNDENLAGIKAGLEKGGNTNYKIKSYKELNHLLQKAKTGNVAEYGIIKETINEEVLKDVKDWLLETNF